jgi:methylmalonyl-CoA/ethylmalonyl-CoA epimerase
MLTKISHIGIAVKNLEQSTELYKKLLASEPFGEEEVTEQKVKVIKFQVGESTIELLEGTSPDSPISKFIGKKGEGIHHIAFESDNINDELKRVSLNGFELINKEPRIGSENMLIAFIKPSSAGNILTEICQH